MALNLPAHPLPKTDAYVLARALVGIGWRALPASPLAHLVLFHLDTAGEKGAARRGCIHFPNGCTWCVCLTART
ncbi:MAG: hypothetical protein HY866_18845 [Chloroflexi bacterium]|nr:hypothetical protein [Chloroflexota bacterium]